MNTLYWNSKVHDSSRTNTMGHVDRTDRRLGQYDNGFDITEIPEPSVLQNRLQSFCLDLQHLLVSFEVLSTQNLVNEAEKVLFTRVSLRGKKADFSSLKNGEHDPVFDMKFSSRKVHLSYSVSTDNGATLYHRLVLTNQGTSTKVEYLAYEKDIEADSNVTAYREVSCSAKIVPSGRNVVEAIKELVSRNSKDYRAKDFFTVMADRLPSVVAQINQAEKLAFGKVVHHGLPAINNGLHSKLMVA